jgi:hypothetical protein
MFRDIGGYVTLSATVLVGVALASHAYTAEPAAFRGLNSARGTRWHAGASTVLSRSYDCIL